MQPPSGYRVSYEYDPDKNMAWYSEEYLSRSGGHVYFALDDKTALFGYKINPHTCIKICELFQHGRN